ncbi:uncharacterized protein LOC129173605 [Dunckerocampus dactyliophorus]|uniref:uncharacterized protein LOC129173605 n=1 Tax=Dunckerocampus dactyliophorus TaxID=161453 RepID=UPI0024064052|nr:uncharacterized protein LOC129173605 [Dunckerocampus dactyliophorus]
MDPAEDESVKMALRAHGQRISHHKQTLNELTTLVRELHAQLAGAPPAVSADHTPLAARGTDIALPSTHSSREPSIPHPMCYEGDFGQCQLFIHQCTLVFSQQPHTYTTDAARVAYMLSLLSGRAASWAMAVCDSKPELYSSMPLFVTELWSVFDHPLREREAGSRLLVIRQGSQSGWNDKALRSAYRASLSSRLQDELASRDETQTLEELIMLAIRLDNRLRERSAQRRAEPFKPTRQLPLPPPGGLPEAVAFLQLRGVDGYVCGCAYIAGAQHTLSPAARVRPARQRSSYTWDIPQQLPSVSPTSAASSAVVGRLQVEDASDSGVGAVLSQHSTIDQKLHPCAFFSRCLSPAERNYDIGNRELLAVILALQEWRHWLEGATQPFTIYTDHQNLAYIRAAHRLNPRQARWALFLTRFNFCITFRPGSRNGKPDALSRMFAPAVEDSSPDAILPQSRILGALRWEVEKRVAEAGKGFPPPAGCPPNRLFVPAALCSEVLTWAHASKIACHPGAKRTAFLLAQRFWWPTFQADT